jgi:D-alanine-D-alanine ligase
MLSVAVLFGGRSPEHWVSFKSGLFILGLLDPAVYRPYAVYIKPDGSLASTAEYREAFDRLMSGNAFQLYTESDGVEPDWRERLRGLEPGHDNLVLALRDRRWDILFPVFHGRFGEDGTIQGMAEFMDIAYAGCNLPGSALGMDKALTKRLAQSRGLAVAQDHHVGVERWREDPSAVLDECQRDLGWPVFVKPARLGSSIGVGKARNRGELQAALDHAFRWDFHVLVEREVRSPEYSIGVIGTRTCQHCSAVTESTLTPEFFDYDAKYGAAAPDDIVPARLPPEQAARLKDFARSVFGALAMDGICRVDMFLGPDGPLLNEVNTMPGLSAFAPFVMAWEEAGLSKKRLVETILEHGLERYRTRIKPVPVPY